MSESVSASERRLPDLLNLSACDDMATLVAALDDPLMTDQPPGPVSAHADQLGGIIVGEAVRLLRIGTHAEVVEAASLLDKYVHGDEAEFLAANKPEAYRLISGAHAILVSATNIEKTTASALMVLSSWGEPACRLVQEISDAKDQRLPIYEVETRVSELVTTQLEAMIEDLRSAALIGIAGQCAPPLLLLGPTARDPQIQKLVKMSTESS